MTWFDSIAAKAGMKALQAGADVRINQTGLLDASAMPEQLRTHANEVVAQWYKHDQLTVDDEYSAALLKLGIYYSAATTAGDAQWQEVLFKAAELLRVHGAGKIKPGVSLQVVAAMGSGPEPASPPTPPPLPPAAAATEPMDYDTEHDLLRGDYEEGAISDEDYDSRFRQLVLDEVTDVATARLAARATLL